MAAHRKHTLSRNLLAVCTFLAPLAVLAWLVHAELERQSAQVRSALDREALQFVRAATASVEQRLDRELAAIADDSRRLAVPELPARTAQRLRQAGHDAVRDLFLLNEQAQLINPMPTRDSLALPYRNSVFTPRGDDPLDHVLHVTDLLVTTGHFDDARRQLEHALDELLRDPGPRRSWVVDMFETLLYFRLGTVQHKLGDTAAALDSFRTTRDRAVRVRQTIRYSGTSEREFDRDYLVVGVLAELALAEAEAGPDARLQLLQAIAAGERDYLGNPGQEAIAERLVAGVPAGSPARPTAEQLLADLAAHHRARDFVAGYNRLLRETVNQSLETPPEQPIGGDAELRQVITPGEPRSLLLLRPAAPSEFAGAAWVGIRLDLDELLAPAVTPYLRTDTLVLEITDSFDRRILGERPAASAFQPPLMRSHGMSLRAFPADVDRYLADMRASSRTSMLLLFGLLLAATIGALWLWRSVSRESELLALKVDLVSRVSHEFKTPLALISLYGETLGLGRAKDGAQVSKFGNIIAREAARLTTMIQRILDFSRQEAGTLRYEPQPTDLGEALDEVAQTYQPHLATKGATLECDLPRGIVGDVDRAALGSVLVNLLENAVKYARDEDPDLSLRVELRRRGQRAEIDVLDRGRGVPTGEREQVFDSFFRASNAGEVRGAGLGLSLVRHFAEAHGGTAALLPRQGGGSIFRITLPLHVAATDPGRGAGRAAAPAGHLPEGEPEGAAHPPAIRGTP